VGQLGVLVVDLRLLTVGVHCQRFRYLNRTLAAYVGEDVSIRTRNQRRRELHTTLAEWEATVEPLQPPRGGICNSVGFRSALLFGQVPIREIGIRRN
jgi:hypothetical protein